MINSRQRSLNRLVTLITSFRSKNKSTSLTDGPFNIKLDSKRCWRDLYCLDRIEDRPSWEALFEQMPIPLSSEEKCSWIGQLSGVAMASDAFFPFRDNIIRAHQVASIDTSPVTSVQVVDTDLRLGIQRDVSI